MAKLIVVPRILGMLFLAHALMLLGADEITTIEMGGIRTIRSLDTILTLYGVDPKPWLMTLPGWLAGALTTVLSWPGWAVLAGIGSVLAYVCRDRG
jgi:hypothetical protein